MFVNKTHISMTAYIGKIGPIPYDEANTKERGYNMGHSPGKKWSTLLGVVLSASMVLSACSKSNDGGSSQSASPNASGSPAPTATEKKPPREIKFLMIDANLPYAKEYKADDKYNAELSRLSGYKTTWEFIDQNTYWQQLTVRFASGDLPDVVYTNSIENASHPNAVENGVFTDLGPLIDKYGPNLKKNIPADVWKSPAVSKNGKIYGIPKLNPIYPSSRVVYVRQDWLDKLGMKQPVTVDDYLAFFEAVKKTDLNGNGEHDEIPFYVRENMVYSELFFGYFGAYQGLWRLRGDKMEPDIIQPQMKEAIKFWKTLYDKGYVNKDMFTTKSSDWVKNIQAGKAAMWLHDVQNFAGQWSPDYFVNQQGVKIGMLHGPVDKNGKTPLVPNFSPKQSVFVIPAKTKNPEDIIKYFDWAWSGDPEANKFFAYGIKGVNYTEENGVIKYDPQAPANTEKDAQSFFRFEINPKQDGRLTPDVLKFQKYGEETKKGLKIANENGFAWEGLNMPALKSMQNHPELEDRQGSLFFEMFAKVVTGKEDADAAFDNFVKEWKRRGGDQAIQEATEWYKSQPK